MATGIVSRGTQIAIGITSWGARIATGVIFQVYQLPLAQYLGAHQLLSVYFHGVVDSQLNTTSIV